MVVLDCEVAGFPKFHVLEQSFALLSKITFAHCTRAIKNSPVHARGSNQQQQALKIWREKRIKNFQGVSECWFCFSVYFVCQLSFLLDLDGFVSFWWFAPLAVSFFSSYRTRTESHCEVLPNVITYGAVAKVCNSARLQTCSLAGSCRTFCKSLVFKLLQYDERQ